MSHRHGLYRVIKSLSTLKSCREGSDLPIFSHFHRNPCQKPFQKSYGQPRSFKSSAPANGIAGSSSRNSRSSSSSGGSHSRSTRVLSFGDGSSGALGHAFGEFGNAYEPEEVAGLPPDVTRVVAGHYHSLAITATGELWSWGRNKEGQLGRRRAAPGTTPGSPVSRPGVPGGCEEEWAQAMRVESLGGVSVVDVAASGVASMAVGGDGSLWAWGASKRGQLGLGQGRSRAAEPQRVSAISHRRVLQVSLGWGHALARTAEGELYAWGYAADGRLGFSPQPVAGSHHASPGTSQAESDPSGLETRSRDWVVRAEEHVARRMEEEKDAVLVWEPAVVAAPRSARCVKEVACGSDHSLLLTEDGRLFAFGDNGSGQLGYSHAEADRWHAVDLRLMGHACRVTCVAAGLGHSLATAVPFSDGAASSSTNPTGSQGTAVVFSWGWDLAGQLGRTPGDSGTSVPGVVPALAGEEVVKLGAARAHSAALTAGGRLFTWGSGRGGRLGCGSQRDSREPQLVEALEGLHVLDFFCGLDHTLVLVADD